MRLHDEFAFADDMLRKAEGAIADQSAVIYHLKSRNYELADAEAQLSELEKELRQWREYRTLLFIRKGMIESQNQALQERGSGATEAPGTI